MESGSPTIFKKASRRVVYLCGWNVQAVHEGIADRAREAGWMLDNSMCYSREVPLTAGADGVIVRHSGEARIIEAVRALNVPAVAFEGHPRLALPCVYYDENAIGKVGARHLRARGFRTLAFLHLRYAQHQITRMEGFRQEVEATGGVFTELAPPQRPDTWHPPPGPDWAWLEVRLREMPLPLGIMVSNDQLARPLIDALVAMGYRVPAQIAVLGAENDPLLCDVGALSVSSVDTRSRRMGYEAACLLDRLMDGEAPPADVQRIPPGEVVTRSSTNIRALESLPAAEALHFIWEHFREPVTIADVADSVAGITRRHLQTLFCQHAGCTMSEELTRLRVEESARLLKTTTHALATVAKLSGFATQVQFHRTLTRTLGMPPAAYRRKGTVASVATGGDEGCQA